MKQGGEHWQWSPETPFYIGVLPRRGAKPSDLKVYSPPLVALLSPSNNLSPLPVVPLPKLFPRPCSQRLRRRIRQRHTRPRTERDERLLLVAGCARKIP